MRRPEDLSREELLELLADAAKNWLAHDGLWFLEVEGQYGLKKALELDRRAWEKFTVVEARRIMGRRFPLQASRPGRVCRICPDHRSAD